jgi:hypothetical protein
MTTRAIPLARGELASEDNFQISRNKMPIAFHLTLSRAAVHAGETNSRVLRVRRTKVRREKRVLLLPASPKGEPEMPPTPPAVEVTPRPTLDLAAPDARRPRAAIPRDVNYDAFGGMSPGFCPTGDCRCGRCGGRRSSRYTYEDYARDYEDYVEGHEEAEYEEAEYEPPSPVETYAEARLRIVKVLQDYLIQLGKTVGRAARESLVYNMADYVLNEPFMREFLDKNLAFKTVLGKKMNEIQLEAEDLEVRFMCGEVVGRFF